MTLGAHLDVSGQSVDPSVHSLLDPNPVSPVSAEDKQKTCVTFSSSVVFLWKSQESAFHFFGGV